MTRTRNLELHDRLALTHRLMLAGTARLRAAHALVEAEDETYAALKDRMMRAQNAGRLGDAAADKYVRVILAPAERRWEAARTAAARAEREARLATRAHDRAIAVASEYTGWAE